MRRKQQGRTLGPYREGSKWRIIAIHEDGQRVSRLYSSKDKAKRGMSRALDELRRRLPLGPQVEPYLSTLRERGLQPTTVATTGALLHELFDGEVAAMWTPHRVEQMLLMWQGIWSVATRRFYLWRVRAFWAWLKQTGKVALNPFDGLKVLGKRSRGKPQLRLDEARKVLQLAVRLYADGLPLALAPVVQMAMGLRSSEIVERAVRDVDDGGKLLWVPYGKTDNARRHLDVPEPLQPLLADLVKGKEPTAPLFGLNRKGKPKTRYDLHVMVRKLCDLAGVPIVCPHSLRGLWATLAVRSGAACEAVARTLGHANFKITAAHYSAPSALDGAWSDAASALLFPKPPA